LEVFLCPVAKGSGEQATSLRAYNRVVFRNAKFRSNTKRLQSSTLCNDAHFNAGLMAVKKGMS
jgi:hypothetical protein